MRFKKDKKGFVLPMIVVTGLVLMIIMAFTLQTISISRENLINQRAQLLARQAAESGLARARQCMQAHSQLIVWDKNSPLRPNTDCYGKVVFGKSAYYSDQNDYRSTFEVYPSSMHDDFRDASSVGVVEIMRQSGSSRQKVRDHKHTTSSYIRTGLTFDDIQFGSVYNYATNCDACPGYKLESVYFHTKTIAGIIKGVGRNVNDILSGSSGAGEYDNGVDLDVTKIPEMKVKKIVTDFQGNGWGTYFITHDNKIYATGSNNRGIKGNGYSIRKSETPYWDVPDLSKDTWPFGSRVLLPDGFVPKQVIIGGSSGYFVSENGELYVVGTNWGVTPGSPFLGLLGCGRACRYSRYVNKPVDVKVLSDNGFSEVSIRNVTKIYHDTMYSATDGVTCAIGNNKESDTRRIVYCWGQNTRLQISDNDRQTYYQYGHVVYDDQSDKPVDVKTNGYTVYILTESGKVYARGDNEYNQLGLHHNCFSGISAGVKSACTLRQIKFPDNVKIVKTAVDSYSALFLDENGTVWGLGLNDMGQLGVGYANFQIDEPKKMLLPAGVKAVDIFITSPGLIREEYVDRRGDVAKRQSYDARLYRNSFVITSDGDVYGAGSNAYGQLGVGNNANAAKLNELCPDEVSQYTQRAARAAASQRAPDFGGYNKSGVYQPVKMCLKNKKPDGRVETIKAKIDGVRAGMGTAIVISENNRVFTVGQNHFGQLGAGDKVNRSIPEAHRLTNLWNVYYY